MEYPPIIGIDRQIRVLNAKPNEQFSADIHCELELSTLPEKVPPGGPRSIRRHRKDSKSDWMYFDYTALSYCVSDKLEACHRRC